MEKKAAIRDFLTSEQIEKAQLVYRTASSSQLHKWLVDQVIRPNMAEINRKLGQENDADYLAYAVEYALTMAAKGKRFV